MHGAAAQRRESQSPGPADGDSAAGSVADRGPAAAAGWRLDSDETLEPSRVLFHADGTWHVLDGPLAAFAGCPVRMERRQRRAYVTAELGGVARRVRFGVIPVDGDAQ